MGYPENPDNVVLKNRFYPNGLTEKDVYEYYINNRSRIIDQVKNRDLMFIIFTDLNKPVVKKKHKGKPIILTPKNYEEMITGRTVSIHSTTKQYEEIGIVDIDADDWKEAKQTTIDVYDELMNIPFIRTVETRYTGKSSFHLVCTLSRKIKIETTRALLENYLNKSKKIRRNYTIQKKRERGIPNIDLYRNVKGSNFITLYSLSFWGLKCIDVPYNKIKSFRQQEAKI